MKLKRPKQEVGARIKAHDASDERPLDQHPAFSLRYVVSDYCITNCTDEQAAQFVSKMKSLCSLPWTQIHSSHRHGLGCEPIARNALKKPVPAHVTEDVKILAFRCFGKAPMLGYRSGNVFYILWFDPNFELYDH